MQLGFHSSDARCEATPSAFPAVPHPGCRGGSGAVEGKPPQTFQPPRFRSGRQVQVMFREHPGPNGELRIPSDRSRPESA